MRGKNLLSHTPHREDLPAQGDLTRHAYFFEDLALGKCRKKGCCHGDTRTRTILRNRTFRNVDVHIDFFEQVWIYFKGSGFGFNIRECSLSGFLHYVSDLPSDLQVTFAFHDQHFNRHDFTTILRPCNRGGYTHFILAFCFSHEELWRSKEFFY